MDRMEDAIVNVNGVITPAAAAVVPVFDHGFLYGEGIYETLRTYNHRPFLINRHLRRLRASADRIGLSIPQSDDELTDSIASTMARPVPWSPPSSLRHVRRPQEASPCARNHSPAYRNFKHARMSTRP